MGKLKRRKGLERIRHRVPWEWVAVALLVLGIMGLLTCIALTTASDVVDAPLRESRIYTGGGER